MVVAALSLAVDQGTKLTCHHEWRLGRAVGGAEDWFLVLVSLGEPGSGTWLQVGATHVGNAGLTFGFLDGSGTAVAPMVFYASSVAGLMVVYALIRSDRVRGVGLGGALLAASGVVGNLLDRVRLGYVIDWVQVKGSAVGWGFEIPTFNLADWWIVGGLAVWMWWEVVRRRRLRHRSEVD